MKNLAKYICLSLLIFTASCKKDFLDVPIQGGATTESDPALAQKLVTGVYNSLLQGDSWNTGDVHGFAFLSVTNIRSDDADKGSFADDQKVPVGDIDDFTITPINEFVSSLWKGHYNSIGNANQALKALATASLSDDIRNGLKAEVLFLRGYLYFNLVRLYGGVPLITRVPTDADDANNDPVFQTRATQAEIYASIESDLQFAIDSLKEKSQSATGHATIGAAKALMAKVCMYEKKWQKVFDLTNEIITSNQYGLVDDYSSIWKQAGENNNESIFEVQTGNFNNTNLSIGNYTNPQGIRSGGKAGWNDLGWGFNDPSLDLINTYEPNDVRKDATIIFIDNSGTHKGTILWDGFRVPSSDSVQNLYYNYKAYTSVSTEKYEDPGDKNRPKNVRILRYADVLLMNAEAALQPEINQPGKAKDNINLIRERAHLEPKDNVTIDDVWKERRLELAMEHDRFFDIVRQGRAAQVMQAAGKSFMAGRDELLPIPSGQIDLSGGKLTQNPNY